MENVGVIEKVNEPADWMNAIACSRKRSGELKICLHPKPLNKFIKTTYYKTPTLEEISHKLAGAKHFIKLEAKHGYWAIHLNEESSLLTCFNTPVGMYKYLRYLFGLKVSQDIFQQKWTKFWKPAKEILVYQMISAYMAEHDRNLRKTIVSKLFYCNGNIFLEGTFMVVTARKKWRDFFLLTPPAERITLFG